MYYSKKDAHSKFRRAIGELVPYEIKKRHQEERWLFNGKEWVNPGFEWNRRTYPVFFSKRVTLQTGSADDELCLRLWFGGESLVRIDGFPFGELNDYHRELDLTSLTGRSVLVEAEVVPRGLFGSGIEKPVFSEALVIVRDGPVRRLLRELSLVNEVFLHSEDDALVGKLYKLLSETLASIKIPRDCVSYAEGVLDDPEVAREVTSVWESESFMLSSGRTLPAELKTTFLKAAQRLGTELENLRGEFPSREALTVAGHAHIDYAWLWPMRETKRKIVRTFANALRLARKYPDFIYSQSSAAMYKDIMELEPELFEKVKELATEERWELIGGMWVESDTNLLGGESLVRQFLYGQRFFMKHFAQKCRTVWLPDVFGFSWILPQIIKKSGLDFFVTTKLSWNEKNKPDRDLFNWRGIDGSQVVYHSFTNPRSGYNGFLGPAELLETLKNFKSKALVNETIFSFGYGDGGGGPTDEMIDNYVFLKDFPGLPELKMRPFQAFFDDLQSKNVSLPVHEGELYLELHRGTYTSQGRMKQAHKRSEDALYLAELLGALTGYHPCGMEELWRTLLHNQFHDILPGSSIREVYEVALDELASLSRRAENLANLSLRALTDKAENFITLFNPSSFERELRFTYDGVEKPVDPAGDFISSQPLESGETLYCGDTVIEALGFVTLKLRKEKSEDFSREISDCNVLENDFLKVTVSPEGLKIYDKQYSRDVFKGKAHLAIYKDIPHYWDGWDIERDYALTGERLTFDSIHSSESGPLRQSVRAVSKVGPAKLVQEITLYSNSRRLEIKNTLDWQLRRTMLRANFPLNILAREAKYDLSCGYISRPTTENTTFERAAFEVPFHRWVDLSEYGYGVSILNREKYGCRVVNNEVSLNLLRSPIFPDFFADEGKHTFAYAVFPHGGSELLNTIKESESFNKEILLTRGTIPMDGPIIRISAPTIKVMALKSAEDSQGKVLRVVELLGARGEADISVRFNFSKVWLTDLLEDKIEKLPVFNGTVRLNYEPFGIYTLLFE